ncbi:hypothetical protein KM295_09010 [Natronomonas sp. F2-12]|jgi:uncharacterized protein (DUF983 family)|uniref:Uncharacterized protein n=1 Tax=Natronomonas aquatica TaxID=2841590 RepID=A0A9R1CTQ2_9EURY|nr:hypothetical protein [Natronomonas aquatica]MCQ4333612.1 hypothetical protein [Natronomonas aquatica]
MSHRSRYGTVDYSKCAKVSFVSGVALLLLGAAGEFVLVEIQWNVPGWVHTLLVDVEIVGVLVALVLPIVFAIVLPLTE